jgi:hypothetical protein
MTDILPQPLKDFWRRVLEQEHLGDFSLRETPEPIIVDLRNQPPPTIIRTAPLQMEICLRLRRCYTVGYFGWHDQQATFLALDYPVRPYINYWHKLKRRDATYIANNLRALKAAFLLQENFGIPYRHEFLKVFWFGGNASLIMGFIPQVRKDELAVVVTRDNYAGFEVNNPFALKLTWQEQYSTPLNPDEVLWAAESGHWKTVRQWLSEAIVEAFLTERGVGK